MYGVVNLHTYNCVHHQQQPSQRRVRSEIPRVRSPPTIDVFTVKTFWLVAARSLQVDGHQGDDTSILASNNPIYYFSNPWETEI